MLEIYVTGTEHNSGKNFITAGLAATMQSLGYSTSVYKPVQTGAIEKNGFLQSPDLAFVKFADPYIKTYFTYLLKSNANPLVAAAAERTIIDRNQIMQDYQSISNVNECTIVDGTSGLATPYGKNFLEEDMIKTLDLPLLLVVSPAVSSINNIIMSINHAKSIGINLRGVIINDYPENTEDLNIKFMPRLIEEYSDAKILGVLGNLGDWKTINPNDLITNILTGVDIEAVFQIQIAKLSL